MAVTIRLARHGKNKVPFYRMVVADHTKPRNGRFLELVGTVNPLIDPQLVIIKQDRIKHWLDIGARPSDRVRQIIAKEIPGYLENLEKKQLGSLQSKRKKRKTAGKGKAGEKSPAKARRKGRSKREKPVQVAKATAEATS